MANTQQARGYKSAMVVDFETAFGQVPATKKGIVLPMNSNELSKQQTLVESDTITNTRNATQPALGRVSVDGDITMPADYIASGYMLKALFGNPKTTGTAPNKTHVFTVGDDQPSLVVEKAFPDLGKYVRYLGVKINTFSVEYGQDSEMTLKYSVMGASREQDGTAYDTAAKAVKMLRIAQNHAYVEIDGTISVLETTTGIMSFTGVAGVYNVRAAFVDAFGEGTYCDSELVTVKNTIPDEWLKNIKIGIEQVDETIKDALDKGKAVAESYTTIVKKVDGAYTAITQLGDDINLRVKKGDVINQINLSPDGVQIDGKFLHVTGDTKFERGVIAKNIEAGSIQGDRIVAGSIGADRLRVAELSAITAKIGTLRTADSGARTEIHDNLILVYDDKDRLRVRMGVW